jgi:L-histidine N-alpha-methyltransferase
MWLRAERAMGVTVRDLGLVVEFAAGEELRTEISAKFRPAGLQTELAAAGFAPVRTWVDPRERFALTLVTAV